ncbi:hypothetical protein vseg_006400 [Gypsophila vaccaria]
MASKFGRFINKSSVSSIRSSFAKSSASSPKSPAPSFTRSPPSSSPSPPRFTFSRIPREFACAASMMPLHDAVATARLTSCLSITSRSCRALTQGTLCRTSPDL